VVKQEMTRDEVGHHISLRALCKSTLNIFTQKFPLVSILYKNILETITKRKCAWQLKKRDILVKKGSTMKQWLHW